MIFERTPIHSLYQPYSIYFRMVVYIDTHIHIHIYVYTYMYLHIALYVYLYRVLQHEEPQQCLIGPHRPQ